MYTMYFGQCTKSGIPGYFLDKIGHDLSVCCTVVSKLGPVCHSFLPALVLLYWYSIFCL